MGSFEVKGMQATMLKFEQLGKRVEPAIKNAVKAGGKLLAEKLQEKAPVRDGYLEKSIKASAVKFDSGDGYSCEVKPEGNHPKTGQSLAKIGNVLEYGRSYGKRHKAPMMWFKPTVMNEESAVTAEIARVFKKETEG